MLVFLRRSVVPVFVMLMLQLGYYGKANAQIYVNGFEGGGIGGTSFTGGATGDPGLNIATSAWSTDGLFTTFVGTSPTAATSVALQPGTAATTTWTLNVPVLTGFSANITSLDLDYRSTSTSYNFLTITINGTPVYAGSVLTDGSFHHLSFPGLSITGVTTSISVVSVMSGGSHGASSTFRYDNVALGGTVVPANNAPTFVNGISQTMSVCQNGDVSLNTALAVNDIDVGQTETWTVTAAPVNGTLSGFSTTTTSTGGVVTPAGLVYTPLPGYIGPDAFTIQVSDGSSSATTVVNMTVMGAPPPVLGATSVCEGAAIGLSNAVTGGTWSSSATSVATADLLSGVVSGVAAGATVISYTSNVTGCAATTTVTVNTAPSFIAGPTGVCAGSQIMLSNTVLGGNWSSDNSAIATVDNAGRVSGVSSGTAIISYSIGSCVAVLPVSVTTIPPITGGTNLCVGGTVALSNATAGGVWSSALTTVATVTPTGVVTAIVSGSAAIYYTIGACYVSVLINVGFPITPVTGPDSLCGGRSASVNNVTPGGVWSSSNTTIAVVSGSGVVSGVTQGLVTISYSLGSCSELHNMYIKAGSAGVIVGRDSICPGAAHSVVMSDAVAGGVWSSTNNAKAVVDVSGRVTGVSSGYDTIMYTVTNTCGTFVAKKRIYIRPAIVCATGYEDVAATGFPELVIFPNPNQGSFTIRLSSAENETVTVVVTNAVGVKVHELLLQGDRPVDVHMSLPPGIYVLTARTRAGIYVARVIIN